MLFQLEQTVVIFSSIEKIGDIFALNTFLPKFCAKQIRNQGFVSVFSFTVWIQGYIWQLIHLTNSFHIMYKPVNWFA